MLGDQIIEYLKVFIKYGYQIEYFQIVSNYSRM